jgi:hypothetical protein
VKPAFAAFAGLVLAAALTAPMAQADPQDFGIDAVDASLSTSQAGTHPDLTFSVGLKQDPATKPNVFGLKDGYATTRNLRFDLPPGLIGDPNVLGVSQQCTAQGLVETGSCPNGSQVGITTITAYQLNKKFQEPLYMMQQPGGDVVARLGTLAGVYPTFIDVRVRSDGDYGLVSEVRDAPTVVRLIGLDTTLWGVPADPSHDNQRCNPNEVFGGCTVSEARPPGSRPLPFLTNPTRCSVPLSMSVSASSWMAPNVYDTKSASFPQITGCNKLPFGPDLTVEPTSHAAASPTGLDLTIRLPRPDGVDVLEPSQMKDIRIDLPKGMVINPGSADGLGVCSTAQVGYKVSPPANANCPDNAKMASAEFSVTALPRPLEGAIYLREPDPGNVFRIWVVADDQGAHVKLPGQLTLDPVTGQLSSVVLDSPQFPVSQVKIVFKSGFRAPLANPPTCGTYLTHYEFTPWSGNPPVTGDAPMTIDQGCDTGGFDPKLSAGSIDADGGAHSPFLFTLTRSDGEQNPQGLDISLPPGLAATFAGIARCEGADAETGACPADSRLGKVIAAVGAGPAPLWVPQAGKRPTAVYLGGPYKGAPTSILAVVPKQAGPFDFGDEVVRSAIYVDPLTGQATAKADPLPQLIEGIPIGYRTLHVILDRPGFTLNPTSCAQKQTEATLTSVDGALAHPTSPFAAVNCSTLPFKPKLRLSLLGAHRRASNPRLLATLHAKPGEAGIAAAQVTLPSAAFLDNSHIQTVCTRVQFAADECPAGSVYGRAEARSPLFDFPLSGSVYLRSSSHPLPDLVVKLKGPAEMPIEIDLLGRTDSVNGALRNSFEAIPDAPVSSFSLELFGGKRGLVELSRDLCAKTYRSTVRLNGQNGKRHDSHPAIATSCKARHRHRGGHR